MERQIITHIKPHEVCIHVGIHNVDGIEQGGENNIQVTVFLMVGLQFSQLCIGIFRVHLVNCIWKGIGPVDIGLLVSPV